MLLITRPRYDTPTHYLFYWSEILIKEANKRGVKFIDLDKAKAEKKKFQSYLRKQPIESVVINGHGSADAVAGNGSEIIFSTRDDASLFKGTNVYLRACDAGTNLGPFIKSQAKGFIGYIQPFMFMSHPDYFNDPVADEYARPVMECSNQVAISLIKGRTIEQAHEDSMSKYREKISEYSSSKTGNSFVLPFLLWNMNFQVCYS